MKHNINTFERHEIKYRLSTAQREMLEQALRAYLQEDAHGQNTIMNVYFDTPDMRIIRRSMERPVYKEKLRLRSYLHWRHHSSTQYRSKSANDHPYFQR